MPQKRHKKAYRRSRKRVERLDAELRCAKMSRAYYRRRARKAQSRLERVEEQYRRRRKKVARLGARLKRRTRTRADSPATRAEIKRLKIRLGRQRDKLARHRARLEQVEKKLGSHRLRAKQDTARLRRLKRKLGRQREKLARRRARLRRAKQDHAKQRQEISEDLAVVSSPSEEPVSPVGVEPTASDAPAEPTPDDLKRVEGVGPKIEALCHDAGIHRFAQLATTPVSELQAILDRAGSRYRIHNPETWPQQAALLAAGRWDEIEELQDRLVGGRPPSTGDAQV